MQQKDNKKKILKNFKGDGIPKIDMHAHYLPQAYKEALLTRGEKNPDGYPTPEWNPEAHLEAMKHLGISTSMLSVSVPHINFGDKNAAKILARKVNEDGAGLVKKYPEQFGLFASLPIPDIKDSIEEIQYALDELHADGFSLPTNALGVYLGDPCLDPILEELNKNKAVVVLHPCRPGCVTEHVLEDVPLPILEYFFDTTRTVANMILKGTLNRFPDIKFVIPHAGAFLSVFADRFDAAMKLLPSLFASYTKNEIDVYAALKGLYYDIAGVCLPVQLSALLQIVEIDHLFYGSDYSYTPEFGCAALADALDKTHLITDEQRRAIYYGNALKLFPRLN